MEWAFNYMGLKISNVKVNMKVNGCQINNMELENTPSPINLLMQERLSIINDLVKENIDGQVETGTKDHGEKTEWKEPDALLIKMEAK